MNKKKRILNKQEVLMNWNRKVRNYNNEEEYLKRKRKSNRNKRIAHDSYIISVRRLILIISSVRGKFFSIIPLVKALMLLSFFFYGDV